jgi:hypothetical protein
MRREGVNLFVVTPPRPLMRPTLPLQGRVVQGDMPNIHYRASAPEMISINSLVIIAWRVRL